MKKTLTIVLALVFVLSIAGTAFAASNPFVDVPAKHWAYDAVSKLAAAGIVDGMGDGTFRGDKTMTRYEMAQIVAKAMARSDKADAANKALIDKLAVEFAKELNNLGVRVAKLEAKTAIALTYESRLRAQQEEVTIGGASAKNPVGGTALFDARQRIYLAGAVNDNVTYGARLEALSTFGGGSMAVSFNRAFFNVKDFMGAFDQLTVGKFSTLGITNGLLNGKTSNNDGFILTKKLGDDVTFKYVLSDQGANSEFQLFNVDFKVNDTFKLNLGYQIANLTSQNTGWPAVGTPPVAINYVNSDVKSWDVGFQGKMGDWFVTGEYVNSKWSAISPNRKAWGFQLTNGNNGYFYPITAKIVNEKKAGADAFALIYRKVEDGATPVMSCFAASYPQSYSLSLDSMSDNNIKGFYFVYQNVVSKGIVWSAEYQDLSDARTGLIKTKAWVTHFQFYF